jgi:cyclomaltodextrinase / maltogenic alpha-amylase / neopullulanase
MTVPYWVQDAIFYQIFPDRFANGDVRNDPPNVAPWGSEPTLWNFMGGDLRGVIQRFDYLLDLGITALYFNPIFLAASNHRYNISDYYRIDPKLGDLEDFHALLEVAHRNDVRVIIDGVFNHCGRGFFAFNDLMENGEHSPYKDWFHINGFPLNAYMENGQANYEAWWNFASLPKFNTDNPAVRNYIFDIARYWIEQGADGWRLDVPNEIDDDTFWAEFRHVVRTANREAYILGEIWDGDPRWVGEHNFDGLMNYPVRDAVLGFLNADINATAFANAVEGLLEKYSRENVYAMYVPLGSHDTERLMTLLQNNLDKAKLAFAFQFAYPGAPAIYYGDELGLQGGKDPDCRRAFPWDRGHGDEELRTWVKNLISLRKRLACLRRGDYRQISVEEDRGTYSFARTLGDEVVLMAINASASPRHLKLPVSSLGWKDGRIVCDLMGSEEFIVSGDELTLTLPPWNSVWLH